MSTGKLLTPREAAEFLGISVITLSIWRCRGRYTVPFVRIGNRIRYRQSDLDAIAQNGTVRPRTKMRTGKAWTPGGPGRPPKQDAA